MHDRFSIAARLRSFGYAGQGLRRLLREEHNAWLHLGAIILVVVAGVFLDVAIANWRWLMLAAALVWIAEALNTAIEALCDRLRPEVDPAIGAVKDLAAGAVLVAAIAAVLIGLLTLGPLLLEHLR